MAPTLYLDASALLKLIIQEPESWALAESLRETGLVTSDLSRVEVRRAILRAGLGADALGLAARVLQRVQLLRIDDPILDRAGYVGPAGLRGLDAIHLASALALGRDLDAVVTYDRRLAKAAEEAGLSVVSPA